MEKKIFKYPLQIKDQQVVELPVGAEILSIQNQNGTVCLWALVNPVIILKSERLIEIFGTGNPIYYDMGINRKYIATFQYMEGQFVGHAFERIS